MIINTTRLLKWFSTIVIGAATLSPSAFAQTAVTVNGTAIHQSSVDDVVKHFTSQPNGPAETPTLRKEVINKLIDEELLYQAAKKAGLDKHPQIKEVLDQANPTRYKQILAQAFIFEEAHSSPPITDEELKAEYAREIKEAGSTEYYVRHILVSTESEAKAIIEKLNDGANFEELARQDSKDVETASDSGDLKWLVPSAVMQPFADAMVKLSKGEITEAPVKTELGYYVIKVEGVRPLTIPDFDVVKDKVMERLGKRKITAIVERLRKNATIKFAS